MNRLPTLADLIGDDMPAAPAAPAANDAAPVVDPLRHAGDTALDRALSLAAEGFYVFPSAAKNKHPSGWPTIATRDATTIRKWFEPGSVYGDVWPSIATGKFGDGSQALLVVDVDPAGLPAVRGHERDLGLAATRTHKTPRGGFHMFYVVPAPGVKSGVSVLATGVDIRSSGGLVYFGRDYALVTDKPIAKATERLVAKCSAAVPAADRKDRAPVPDAGDARVADAARWLAAQEPAVEGSGGDARTYTVACGVRDLGVSEAQAVELMLEHFNPRCSPPWDNGDLRTKVRNAYSYAASAPGQKVTTANDLPDPSDAPPAPQQQAGALFTSEAKAAPKSRRRIATTDELGDEDLQPARFLIEGMLFAGSHAVGFGPPGEGKSFVFQDAAYAVAQGRRWHGYEVNQSRVLYIAYEGTAQIRARVRALKQRYGQCDNMHMVLGADYDLSTSTGRGELASDIAALPSVPGLIIIDTMARALGRFGGDENSAKDVGLLNDAVAALIQQTGACVVLIHHSGKDESRGARGSNALLGAVDTEIRIRGRTVETTKQRDAEEKEILRFDLKQVEVGTVDGKPVTSCVVVKNNRTSHGRASNWKPRDGNTKHAWEAMVETTGAANAPAEYADVRGAFRRRAYPDGDVSGDTVKKSLRRALSAMIEARVIEEVRDGVWRRRLFAPTAESNDMPESPSALMEEADE